MRKLGAGPCVVIAGGVIEPARAPSHEVEQVFGEESAYHEQSQGEHNACPTHQHRRDDDTDDAWETDDAAEQAGLVRNVHLRRLTSSACPTSGGGRGSRG